MERCESGRIGLTANELTWVTGSEGSNPSLSARESGTWCRTIRTAGPLRRACRAPSPRREPAWCEECVTSWAATGCRPWGARRTRSTPTSWRATSPRRDTAPPPDPETADLVVVNTCAFIDAARQESIDTVLTLADRRRHGARLVVTGCMAERYGDELRDALPEVDLVAGFGAELTAPAVAPSTRPRRAGHPDVRAVAPPRRRRRPTGSTSWSCPGPPPAPPGPTSRWPRAATASAASAPSRPSGASSGPVRPRTCWPRSTRCAPPPTARRPCARSSSSPRTSPPTAATARARAGATRIANGPSPIAALTRAVSARVERTRLLYLYPSGLTDELIETVLATGVPYFDLSLQHVSRPLLAGMRRWGDGERFLRRIDDIRAADPERHVPLLLHPRLPGRDRARPRPAARVPRGGAARLGRLLPVLPRGRHPRRRPRASRCRPSSRSSACASAPSCRTPSRPPSATTSSARPAQVLVDAPGQGRTVHEAPEIDGIVHLPDDLAVGSLVDVTITGAEGPDLYAVPAADRDPVPPASQRVRRTP